MLAVSSLGHHAGCVCHSQQHGQIDLRTVSVWRALNPTKSEKLIPKIANLRQSGLYRQHKTDVFNMQRDGWPCQKW